MGSQMENELKVSAIIAAGGSGTRMKATVKKQYLELKGKPIIVHTIKRLSSIDRIKNIILSVPPEDISYCKEEIVDRYNLKKVNKIIAGGEVRQDSVYNALMELSVDTDIVVVHDAVRPFTAKEILETSIDTAERDGAAVTAVPESDTVKEVSKDLFIIKTLNRDILWRMQTPQTFKKKLLIQAFEHARKRGITSTDEAALLEGIGIPVKIVQGSYLNIKITTPEDMMLGEFLLSREQR